MKRTVIHLSALAVWLAGAACERHDWEETKKLHEHHGGHEGAGHAAAPAGEHGGDAAGGEHGDAGH